MKDVELNQLKSVKMELEQDLRDCRQTIDRVRYCQVLSVELFPGHFPFSVIFQVSTSLGNSGLC